MEKNEIEFIPLEDFMSYKMDIDEPLTAEEQIDRLHKEFPNFRREVIKCMLGLATDEDISVLKEEQDKIKAKFEEGGYKLVNGKFIKTDDLENFMHNKIEDYEPTTLEFKHEPDTKH